MFKTIISKKGNTYTGKLFLIDCPLDVPKLIAVVKGKSHVEVEKKLDVIKQDYKIN